jgi:hypothetical protein
MIIKPQKDISMRCNVGINPNLLVDQHLCAEFVEVYMLIGSLRSNGWKIKSKIPEKFTLGTGHMNFLKNKLTYLESRHRALKEEMKRRGFKYDKVIVDTTQYPKEFCNNWQPTIEDSMIIRKRISEKLQQPHLIGWWRKNRVNLTEKDLKETINNILNSELFYV